MVRLDERVIELENRAELYSHLFIFRSLPGINSGGSRDNSDDKVQTNQNQRQQTAAPEDNNVRKINTMIKKNCIKDR